MEKVGHSDESLTLPEGYELKPYQIPDIITPDEDLNESGYQEGSEGSFGDFRRDSVCLEKYEGWEGADSDSGVDGGNSSGCSTADDCPVVSVNDVVAYYELRPRRRVPPLSFYSLDIEKLALDAYQSEPYLKATVEKTQLLEGGCEPSEGLNGSEIGAVGGAGTIATVTGLGSGVALPVEACERSAVLSYEQVRRLHDVMEEVVGIHGRGNFPTLQVKLRELVAGVRAAVLGAGVVVRGVRLNGGAASHVVAATPQPYSDIDLIFSVDLPTPRHADRLRTATLTHLSTLLPAPLNAHPQHASRRRPSACTLKEAYVSKMVKVNSEGDRWSLISLGNSRGHKSVELKFVDTMRRQFEFSVDSFQIALDSLLEFHDCAQLPIGENFYPTVVGESVYGDFHEALYHLCEKLIATRQPEEIRGGGLLKYCALLAKGYRPAEAEKIKTLERYMCSRFFIDFPDLNQQRAKLEAYLRNHFVGREEESLKYRYLTLLHSVVRESTVCLMGHERRQTLALIEMVATRELCAERARHHHQVAVQQAAAHQVAAQQVAAHQVAAHQVAGAQVGAQHQQQAVLVPGYYVACWCGPCCAPCCCAECWGCPA